MYDMKQLKETLTCLFIFMKLWRKIITKQKVLVVQIVAKVLGSFKLRIIRLLIFKEVSVFIQQTQQSFLYTFVNQM